MASETNDSKVDINVISDHEKKVIEQMTNDRKNGVKKWLQETTVRKVARNTGKAATVAAGCGLAYLALNHFFGEE